jgi:hypothetical protein
VGVSAALSVHAHIQSGAAGATNEDWRNKNHLEFAPISMLAAAVTAAAPLLTAPRLT